MTKIRAAIVRALGTAGPAVFLLVATAGSRNP